MASKAEMWLLALITQGDFADETEKHDLPLVRQGRT